MTAARPLRTPETGRPVLRIVDVGHRFDGRVVLRDIRLVLEPGDRVAVTGPNGAGKSTLLKIVAGLLRPAAGRIERGTPARAGYLGPDLEPWGELSARDNLGFLARIGGRAAAAPGALDWLVDGGFPSGRVDDAAGSLSTGLRQRLKLAMAWLGRPELLVLDEPGANLDESGRALVARLVAESSRNGAVLLATNDAAEAALGERRLELALLD